MSYHEEALGQIQHTLDLPESLNLSPGAGTPEEKEVWASQFRLQPLLHRPK